MLISSHIRLEGNKAAVEVTVEGATIDCAIPRGDIKAAIKKLSTKVGNKHGKECKIINYKI